MNLLEKRHPNVPFRRVPLSEQRWELQKQRGLTVVERGEPLAIPVDRLDEPNMFMGRDMWRFSKQHGIYRPGAKFSPPTTQWQRRVLTWLRDHVDHRIPQAYYYLTLGHDLHTSVFGNLYAQQWHRGWVNPFTKEYDEPHDHTFETAPWHPGHIARRTEACVRHAPAFSRDCRACDDLSEPIPEWRVRAQMVNWGSFGGFSENLGWLSGSLVTTAFDSEIVDELVSTTGTEFADFDFHEVGTNAAAEANTHTALQTTSGIARATGTPVDEDPDYANDATITADATETWEEHGIFNNSTGAAMMDRNLTGGQGVNSSDQVTYQYTVTFNPET